MLTLVIVVGVVGWFGCLDCVLVWSCFVLLGWFVVSVVGLLALFCLWLWFWGVFWVLFILLGYVCSDLSVCY